MAAQTVRTRNKSAFPVRLVLTDYSNGAVTTGTNKREWVVPFAARILDVVAVAQTAGSGSGNTILDVNVDGTSIFAATGDRPTLAAADTGGFAVGKISTRGVRPGQVISYDVDSVPATSGHARVMLSIVLGMP